MVLIERGRVRYGAGITIIVMCCQMQVIRCEDVARLLDTLIGGIEERGAIVDLRYPS